MNRVPSMKALCDDFPQSDPAELEKFRKWAKRGERRLALIHADTAIGGFGGESIRCPSKGLQAVYVNTGDTYNATLLCHIPSGAWRITTWGDYVETYERRHGRAAMERLSCR